MEKLTAEQQVTLTAVLLDKIRWLETDNALLRYENKELKAKLEEKENEKN